MIDELNLMLEDYIKIKDIEMLNGLSIYQVKVNDILLLGETKYSEFLLPFSLTLDVFNFPEEIKSQVSLFDIFFIKELNMQQDYMKNLIDALKFFLSTDNITLLKDNDGTEYKAIIIDNEYILNEDNFDLLCDCILQINQKERIVIEKEPVYEGENAEKKLAIWRKMTKGRKENEAKEGLSLAEIIKLVKHGNIRYMSKEEIKNMTLYDLYSTYKLITSEKGFDYGFSCSLAGVEIKREDDHPIKNWVRIFKSNTKKNK